MSTLAPARNIAPNRLQENNCLGSTLANIVIRRSRATRFALKLGGSFFFNSEQGPSWLRPSLAAPGARVQQVIKRARMQADDLKARHSARCVLLGVAPTGRCIIQSTARQARNGYHGRSTAEALDKETLDKESRVSRPMDGRSWATHLASKQEGMRQGPSPQQDIPYPMPPA